MNDDKSRNESKSRATLRQAMGWALVLSSMISTPVLSAQTDISSSPITSTNAAQVKPNVMLLVDASGSMGWGHMPDEVETQVGYGSIGYKAAQCNVVYYNRNLTYALPKQADGSPFTVPSFTSAPYDGYSAFDSGSTATVDLSSSFKAYDDLTLRTSGYNDTPQPAYYYYKTGGTVPIVAYNSTPCTDGDANMTVPSSDGGTWTRVIVGAGSGVGGADERTNFAIWYSYYRIRILLIKTAASLAFTPLTDSFRVGFITVKPKDNKTDVAINPDKYLAIDDFNTVQRGLWFAKLFSQVPSGSSPTREGLARVGRHYAGKQDGINAGMTGDPVQYSCQQNFTIMTTDGYWNAQDESTPQGSFIGGPVDISGQALVGQRDGTLNANSTNSPSPPPATDYNTTPRPIWDGTFDGTRTITTKTVHYSYAPCGTYFNMSTTQLNQSTSQLLKTTSQSTQSTAQNLQSTTQNLQATTQTLQSTSQTTQSTVQNLQSTVQNLQSTAQQQQSTTQITRSTAQTLQATTQNLQSTVQNLASTTQFVALTGANQQEVVIPLQSTVQNIKSTSQLTRSTSQQKQQTSQITKSTSQVSQSTTQTSKTTAQTVQSTAQNLQSTTQNQQSTNQVLQSTSQTTQSTSQTLGSTSQTTQSTSQLQISTSQVRKSTSQLRSCDSSTELCTPGPVGSCTPGGNITCDTVTTGPTLVTSCANDPASLSNNWTTTTCATTSTGPTPAGSCTAAAASPGNSYTTTTCNTATTGPTPVASCNPAIASSANAYTATTCNTATTGPTPAATCTPAAENAGNAYTTTTCTTNTTGPTPVSACAAQTAAAGNAWTTTTCATGTTTNVPVASCTAAAASAGNAWTTTTCTPNNTSNVNVASCTSSAATAGNGWTTTTCSTNNTTNVPVQTCTASGATAGNGYTTTTCSTNNTTNVPSGTCLASAASAGNGWTTTTCGTVNAGPTPVDAATCTAAAGSAGNNWTTTTCPVTNTGPTPVASCSAAGAAAGNNWTTTTCSTATTGPTPIGACAAIAASAGNAWTATTCATNTSAATPVSSCTPVAAAAGNAWTATLCPVTNTGPTGVSACAASAASAGNSWTTTTCNTVNTGPAPAQTCVAAAAAAGNNWTSTTCSNNNTTNVQVNTCSASAGTAANSWVTTTCPAPTIISNWTNVQTCTASAATNANGHQQTLCRVTNGTTPVQPGTCVPQAASAANNWVTTTCQTNTVPNTPVQTCTPAAATAANNWTQTSCSTNNTTNVAVQTCSASAATAGNLWTTTTCSTNNTGPTPVSICTPIAATAGNSWTTTTCPTNNTGPTGVAACASIAPTAGNNWTTTSCGTNNTSNVPVSTCTPAVGSAGNAWTTTTCPTNNVSNTPVASCTPSAKSAANNWTTTTCGNNNTSNVAVASCSPSVATAANQWTTTTCGNNNTTNVPSGACVGSAASAANSWTTTTCPILTTGPTGVSSCVGAVGNAGNSWTTTTCAPNNTSGIPVASCSASAASAANSWTATSCSTNNTTNVAVASCSAGAPTGSNGYTTTTCSNNNTTNVPSGSCTPTAATAGNGWTTTTCPIIAIGPIGASSCTAASANAGNAWTTTTCPGTATTGPTPAASCTYAIPDNTNSWTHTTCSTATTGPTVVTTCNPAAANAGNNYTATVCAPLSGSQLATTTYTRVQQYSVSGGARSSVGTDVTTANGPNASGTCYAPNTQPSLPVDGTATWTAGDTASYPSCSAWPCTVDDNTGNSRSVNSLADVAQYYYITDLRTAANEPRGPAYYQDDVPAVGSGPEDDKARWQHMTTFSIALGVSGTIKYVSDYRTSTVSGATDSPPDTRFADIRVGTDTSGIVANWPLWPDPTPGYYTDPTAYNDPRSIDDFWHAAVNGRGQYFSAGNPTSVIAGLSGALAGITARVASSTGAGTSNLEPVPGDNFVYLANYTTQKWTGDLQAHEIDVNTGIVQPAIIWSAQSLLDATVGNLCDNRQIMLFRSGAANNLVNFTWNTQGCDISGSPTGAPDTGLNAAEQGNFGALNVSLLSQYPSMTDGTLATVDQRTPAAGANLVNFLRGQRGLENFTSNVASELYRKRDHVLGDTVNGQPVYVRAPFASYSDTGYAAFKTANVGRTPMLYVPANDGMLHAFYAGTGLADPQGGKEAWAIIPSSVLPKLYTLADANYQNVHQYFVDGTPSVSDVYDGSNWKTLLVGGLNDGGRSFYALDVTDPVNPKGMWEFSWSDTCYDTAQPATAGADCQLGLSFGHPLISKLADGRWVVMVTSGYNNVNATPKAGDGVGYLYVLDALSGQIIYKIPTGVGDPTTPSGLAQINNFVDKADINNLTIRVYGTDVLGNIWRFDVNDNTPPSGREATLVGTATDPGGTPQPITIRPELTQVGDLPMLFVATGRLLGATDVADVQTQSIYGIIDPVVGTTAYANLRTALAPLSMTQLGSGTGATRSITCTGTNAQCASASGWRVDLPDTGERVNVEMKLRANTLIIGSNVPQISACSAGGYSWLNYLNYRSGLAVTGSAGLAVSEQVANSLIVGLTVIKLSDGTFKAIVTTSDAGVLTRNVPTFTQPQTAKRVSWREVTSQ